MSPQRKQPQSEAQDFAESVIFRWYTRCQEEHDQLSSAGLAELQCAIEECFDEARTKHIHTGIVTGLASAAKSKPPPRKARR